MARIRSIHPGLFTDEDFAPLSMAARVLLIGLWTEADDGGAFAWKPPTIKMRILPADSIDVVPLLKELEAADKIKMVEIDGRNVGLVRNFSKYQRPKKPKFRFVIPPEFQTYVGSNNAEFRTEVSSDDASSEHNDDEAIPIPKKTEIAPQIEGGRRKEGGGKEETRASALRSDWPSTYRQAFWEQYPNKVGKNYAIKQLDKLVRSRDGPSFEDLMGALRRYCAKTDDRPWCNPATWLNQGRWTDQPAARNEHEKPRGIIEAADELRASFAQFEVAQGPICDGTGETIVWPVSERRSE